MVPSLTLMLVGLVALTAGAELLVRGASGLAARAGLSPLVIGLTVVAFGTSAPELAVSIDAALAGSGGIAAGNVVGSNIFNVAVILGIAALVCPLRVHLQVVRWDMPVMLVASVTATYFLVSGGRLARSEGGVLLAGIVLYTWMAVWLARRQSRQPGSASAATTGGAPGTPSVQHAQGRLPLQVALAVVGVALLVLGGHFFVASAVELAGSFGVSDAVIGLTVVAAGTSLPELATSVVASLRRETDIAVGNVVGSNIFNLLSILGASAMVSPVAVAEVQWLDFGFMLGTSVLLLPLMWTGFRISRPEAVLLLAGYGTYLFVRWPANP